MNLRLMVYGLLAGALLLAKPAYPDPAPGADYSQAVSLFNAKDYKSALPLFQKVVRDDPANAQAYYYLGSCEETVGDLRDEVLNYYISYKLAPDPGMKAYADKMMDKLSPEDQDWVQNNFDAFANPTPQPTTQPTHSAAASAAAPAPGGDYAQAVSLFNAKDYPAALPLFQQVVQDEPQNAKAYYYLGRCQDKAGYRRGAVLNFYISDRLQPYPALKTYADKVMEKLSLEDQDWVEQHLNSFSQSAAALQTAPSTPAGSGKARFGLRASTGFDVYNLDDFQAEISFVNYIVQGYEASNPNDGYHLQTAVPSTDATIEINPYFTLGPDGEVGASFVYWLPTSVSYNLTAYAFPGYFVHSEWDLNSFECLLKGRLYFPTASLSKALRFFLEPALGFQPISIHWVDNFQDTSGTPSSDQVGWDTANTAFDAGLKLGAVFNLSRDSLFSFSVGYQAASASNFTGTYRDNNVPAMNGVHGSMQMYSNPTTGQRYLTFVPDNPSEYSNFGDTASTLSYCKPLTVDESGFRLALDFSRTF